MTEVFPNISEGLRFKTNLIIKQALAHDNPYEGAKLVASFCSSLSSLEEKDYVDFCFACAIDNLKKEQ